MIFEDLVDLLNEDLSREFAHWHFYMHAAMVVSGPHRDSMREYFLEEAKGEMQHVQEFGCLIVGRGKIPTTKVADFNVGPTDPKSLVEEALRLEETVVANYLVRLRQAEGFSEMNGPYSVAARYIVVFLEDQLEDSHKAIDHLRQIFKGF